MEAVRGWVWIFSGIAQCVVVAVAIILRGVFIIAVYSFHKVFSFGGKATPTCRLKYYW